MSSFPRSNSTSPRRPSATSSSRATEIPTVCPTCQSPEIATTAKSPDASSYWRCTSCGEIWNNARHHGAPVGVTRSWP